MYLQEEQQQQPCLSVLLLALPQQPLMRYHSGALLLCSEYVKRKKRRKKRKRRRKEKVPCQPLHRPSRRLLPSTHSLFPPLPAPLVPLSPHRSLYLSWPGSPLPPPTFDGCCHAGTGASCRQRPQQRPAPSFSPCSHPTLPPRRLVEPSLPPWSLRLPH